LKEYSGALFFVTHDRMFMSRLATKIMELDRGKLFSWSCDYKTFLERKTMALEAEEAERGRFDKKLAQEEAWMRQGVKARRTRNEGRVRALEALREKKKAQRLVMGKVRMQVQEADRSGQLVIKAENLSHGYGEIFLIRDFSTQIMRGDKIGVMGPNGSGKTTLLRILLGEVRPQGGTVTLGTNLEVSYYDQLREQLDEDKTVKENVCGEMDTVTVDGASRNVMGYLQDFLFSSERARTPVKLLSGGERNRLLLARLFTRPSNLLVLDEPTNDLDVETLELLEELLVRYTGTLLLVSHDRAFLNNVVTSTLVLEGEGRVHEYPGGYDDWMTQRSIKSEPVPVRKKTVARIPEAGNQAAPRKLSFNELRELEKTPGKIEELESEHQTILGMMADPFYYQKDPKELAKTKARLQSIDEELARAYERWEALEGLKHERG
jgi:ATP-binding cassette subfamily F protein uup